MSKVMKLTFNGSFRVLGARETTLRCGPHKMPRLIQYTTTISSKPELLDERGFIIDWRDISSAVAHHYRFVNKFPSCEQFSSEICDIVAKLLNGRCFAIDVEVSIKGLPARMNTTNEYDNPSGTMDALARPVKETSGQWWIAPS